MKVEFQFKDKKGSVHPDENILVDMGRAELTALFNAKEVEYPVKVGPNATVKVAVMENSIFSLYSQDHVLKITLIEK